jgi:hypothetical protein
VLIVIIWFEYKVNENINHVFIVTPATIVNDNENTKNIGMSLSSPLNLKIVERSAAYSYLQLLRALDTTKIETKIRKLLDSDLADEWSYSQINNLGKGNKIKYWAKTKGYSCPGNLCGKIELKYLKNSDITFGHIVPQNWARIFPHNLNIIHHPDNLYLTCKACNSQLGDNFPDISLKNFILNKYGTIGDWIRECETEIRNC